MEEFLKDTYGVTVYQEQVMLLSQKLAGFTKGQADKLRTAMGKKQTAIMNALYRPGPMDYIPDFVDRKLGLKPIDVSYTHLDVYKRQVENLQSNKKMNNWVHLKKSFFEKSRF